MTSVIGKPEKSLGMNNKDLRHKNRGHVLKLICTRDEISRIEISNALGLTKMTVTNIINELTEMGLVRETQPQKTPVAGRNPVILDISPAAPKIIGVYISRNGCTCILSDLKLNMIKKGEAAFDNETAETLVEKISSLIKRVRGKESNLLAIGISAIGPVNAEKGVIVNPPDFFGVRDLSITDILSERFSVPVFLNNDMNCSAVAEKLFGKGGALNDFIYVGITNGIGSGIITDGKLFQCGSGFVGEIGHTCINFEGEKCSCGNKGCLEVYASIPKVERALREKTGAELSFREYCQMHEDPVVDGVLSDMVYKLSIALVNEVNMMNPQAVFIGHEGAFLPCKYIDRLGGLVNGNRLLNGYDDIQFDKSSFNENACVYGSVCCVLEKLFFGDDLDWSIIGGKEKHGSKR